MVSQFPVPDGWLPFGSLVDYQGPSECSEEVGEDGLPLWERPLSETMYDIARRATDEVLGEGAYAEINAGNPDPLVQAAIRRASGLG